MVGRTKYTDETTGQAYKWNGDEWVEDVNGGGAAWGDITGTLSAQTDLQAELDAKAASGHNHDGTYEPAKGADDNFVTAAEKAALHANTLDHTRLHSITDTSDHSFPGGSTFLRADGAFASPPGGTEAFPVGSVFLAVVATSPATLLGYGTWLQIAAGQFLVGQNSGDADFDTAEETGGAKTHTLTATEIPAHSHVEQTLGTTTGGVSGLTRDTSMSGSIVQVGVSTAETGGGGAHNNLPPYFTVYIYKRTA